MRDILPSIVIDTLRDRYMAAVLDAESTFDMNAGDEDSLTGALGQAIAMPREHHFYTPEGVYSVEIGYTKLRGRGPNAPERVYGSDGIFQIRVLDKSGKLLRAKGLPFQSKKGWKGKNSKLLGQAKHMEQHTPGGIVIAFDHDTYEACKAEDLVVAKGSRPAMNRSKKMYRLGKLLADNFLDCKIGTLNLYFDSKAEKFEIGTTGVHIISTDIAAPYVKTET